MNAIEQYFNTVLCIFSLKKAKTHLGIREYPQKIPRCAEKKKYKKRIHRL